jgi:hypothetical protein
MFESIATSLAENWLGKLAASLASRSGLPMIVAVITADLRNPAPAIRLS